MEGEKKPSALSDVGAWGMNVISSVGIIMANKQLMSPNGYAFSFGQFHFPSPLDLISLYLYLYHGLVITLYSLVIAAICFVCVLDFTPTKHSALFFLQVLNCCFVLSFTPTHTGLIFFASYVCKIME